MAGKWTCAALVLAAAALCAAVRERRYACEAESRASAAEFARLDLEARLDAGLERERRDMLEFRTRIATLQSQIGTGGEADGPPGSGTSGKRRSGDENNADRLYESAKDKMRASEFEAALEDLDQARRLDPGSVLIRDLFNEVSRIMNRKPAEWADLDGWAKSNGPVKISQTRIEVENRLQAGEKLMAAERYDEAGIEFDAVIEKLKWVPYDIGMNDKLELASSRLEEALRFSASHSLGAVDYSDATGAGGILDPDLVLGETGIFTREHFGGANEFYDLRRRSSYPESTTPLVTNIPDFPVGTRLIHRDGEMNQGVSFVEVDWRPASNELRQGLTWVEPSPDAP